MRKLIVGSVLVFAACSLPITKEGGGHADPSAPDATVATGDGGDGNGTVTDAAGAPTCNGYEPCGINPVVVPTGYTLLAGTGYNDGGTPTIVGSCTSFDECGMWENHYTAGWYLAGNPVPEYYNEMGSPFPWGGGRYEISVAPKQVSYVKLHVLAPGEMYRYSDGSLEVLTERATGATTCFQRGAGRMETANLDSLGGTGTNGLITWNISVLPGDMGSSGNASSCSGVSAQPSVALTADPVKAATTVDSQGAHAYCLLREGSDYYINFMSTGSIDPHFDCATGNCTMGGLTIADFVGSDGSQSPQVGVPCE